MDCPHCSSSKTAPRVKLTKLGYKTFKCHGCGRSFNERTGTPFNRLCLRTEIVFEVVLWRLRYKLSLRNLAEMFLVQGYVFDHETVRHWEEQFAPLLSEELKAQRHGKATFRWKMDETVRPDRDFRFSGKIIAPVPCG